MGENHLVAYRFEVLADRLRKANVAADNIVKDLCIMSLLISMDREHDRINKMVESVLTECDKMDACSDVKDTIKGIRDNINSYRHIRSPEYQQEKERRQTEAIEKFKEDAEKWRKYIDGNTD